MIEEPREGDYLRIYHEGQNYSIWEDKSYGKTWVIARKG